LIAGLVGLLIDW